MAKGHEKESGVKEMGLEELRRMVQRGIEAIRGVGSGLPSTVVLTQEDRIHADGRLKKGESATLTTVLDTADSAPQYFKSLASRDGGRDPEKSETEWLRELLARRDLLSQLAEEVESLSTRLNDTVLHLGEKVRPVALAAYQIGKAIAATDDDLRTRLAPAIDFYSAPARRAAATRRQAGADSSKTP